MTNFINRKTTVFRVCFSLNKFHYVIDFIGEIEKRVEHSIFLLVFLFLLVQSHDFGVALVCLSFSTVGDDRQDSVPDERDEADPCYAEVQWNHSKCDWGEKNRF